MHSRYQSQLGIAWSWYSYIKHLLPLPYMIAWRSKLHSKTADCTLASVAHSVCSLSLPLLSHGNFHCGRLAALLRKFDTERVGSSKVKSTRTARISTIPGSIFELASLCGKMPLICQQGQVPRHIFTTPGNCLSETSQPLRKKLQRYGLH